MSNPNLVQIIIKDESGRDAVMVRVDKTAKEMMEEKPSSRWDARYWHPKYEILNDFLETKHTVQTLSTFILGIQQGDVPRASKGDKYVDNGIIFINVAEICDSGIIWINCKRITEKHYLRIKRAEPTIGDLIFVRSGKGSIGKSTLFMGIPREQKIGIFGHLNIVKLKEINSYYVECFLKTSFGQQQIERFEAGTSQQTDFRQESFAAIKIPILKLEIQKNIESEYKKMSAFHNKAMDAKKRGDEAGSKKSLETAEKMLHNLVARTEAVIRGERDDVI
ncbi:MAG: hypothetical protein HY747_11905 [Elusimicrobia bacterium]|nr:hypothetical protein [Elusimicrobiota bacterium]